MIQSLGLFSNLYIYFQLLRSRVASHGVGCVRIIMGILAVYQILSMNLVMYLPTVTSSQVYFDGMIQFNKNQLISMMYIIFQVIFPTKLYQPRLGLRRNSVMIIFQMMSHMVNNENSTSLYLIAFCNIIGQEFQFSSIDWVITLISWEFINISQYLQVSLGGKKNGAATGVAIKYKLTL